jgi:RNA polymerase primary sigma factor
MADRGCMKKTDVALSRYLRDLADIPLLTPEEEIELAGRIQNGDEAAREQMIRANLRLVITIAHDYVDLDVPLMDLIAEGNVGLMHAVDRFDPSRGAKLSTYAISWIKQTIKRALADQSRTVRVPSQIASKVTRMRRVSAQLSSELGREVTEEEISEELGIATEKIAKLKTIGLRPESLDASVGNDDETALSEIIADEQTPTPLEFLREKDYLGQIDVVLRSLDKREATIIEHRFGLHGLAAKTLEQVSELIGVTRERVGQLEVAALAKLRRAFKKLRQSGSDLAPVEPQLLAAA